MQKKNKVQVPVPLRPQKVKAVSSRPKITKSMCRSKILKCIVNCLEKKKHSHMLYWHNQAKREFIIVFVHKNNPMWNPSCLDLFRELDGLSKRKLEMYLKKLDYESACKVRCKSNLKKLCLEGALSFCWRKKESRSKFSDCYKINDSTVKCLSLSSELEIQRKETYPKILSRDETVQGTIKDDFNIGLFNPSSDFPCLSNKGFASSYRTMGESFSGSSANASMSQKYVESGWELISFKGIVESFSGSTDGLINSKNNVKECLLKIPNDLNSEKLKPYDNNAEVVVEVNGERFPECANISLPRNAPKVFEQDVINAVQDSNATFYNDSVGVADSNIGVVVKSYPECKPILLCLPNSNLLTELDSVYDNRHFRCDDICEVIVKSTGESYAECLSDSKHQSRVLNFVDVCKVNGNDSNCERKDEDEFCFAEEPIGCNDPDVVHHESSKQTSFDMDVFSVDGIHNDLEERCSLNSCLNLVHPYEGLQRFEDPFFCCGSPKTCRCMNE